ncbi:30S ribosomal protein S20 [uncultured Adlercreutzia sp.]|uniref:30S ribosomal protein S20 n=1 Tax=uncultured Adlercreutzia sp. TaxID=875803 RepID=UPI0025EDBDD5|nr:30S ribosomal protein S20 [uncultured Adlercreutzia sp.]
MANIKSQKKRIITNEKARMRNRAVKAELKTAIRHVKDAVAAEDGKAAYAFACEACRLMDKAVSKGVIHKNQAANRKSGIMHLANTVVTPADIEAYEKMTPKAPKTGSKKAEARAARKAAMAQASEEKAKRREKQLKEEKKAAERKAKEAEEAAKAEAEAAAAEAAEAEEAPAEEAAAE